MDKMLLVRLLKEEGEVVGVTGDGTNDAPALNLASCPIHAVADLVKDPEQLELLTGMFNHASGLN